MPREPDADPREPTTRLMSAADNEEIPLAAKKASDSLTCLRLTAYNGIGRQRLPSQ